MVLGYEVLSPFRGFKFLLYFYLGGGGARRAEEDSLLNTPQLFSLTTIDKIRKIWYICF